MYLKSAIRTVFELSNKKETIKKELIIENGNFSVQIYF